MRNKYFYPAIFHEAQEGGYWVSFPDIPECLTQGSTLDEAYYMANEVLGLALEDRVKENDIPLSSNIKTIKTDADSITVLIEFDMLEYRKKHDSRAVKKTLSIPAWLNEEATEEGINFSQVLQDALKMELDRRKKVRLEFVDE